MKKVSVIIPTYNNEGTILRAVNSVLNQTYKNIEVIIINDGSTDNTDYVLEAVKKKKNVKYYKQRNMERSYARNRGIENASGEYIGFLDADDEYLEDKIEKQVHFLEEHSSYAMVYSNVLYEVDGRLVKKRYGRLEGRIYPKIIKKLSFFHTPNVLLRKEVFDKICFDERMTIHEDWDLWINIAKKYEVGFLDEYVCIIHKAKNKTIDYTEYVLNDLYLLNKLLSDKTLSTYYRNYVTGKIYYEILSRGLKAETCSAELENYMFNAATSLLLSFQLTKLLKLVPIYLLLKRRPGVYL